MNSYLVGLVVSLSLLALSFAAQSPSAIEIKEEQAIQQCNVTNPVHQNIRLAIGASIVSGEMIHLSHEEKCHFNCFLQKVGFFDANSNVNGEGLVKFTMKNAPHLAKYGDVVIAQIFQLERLTKGFDDKCQKAFVTFHQYTQGIFQLLVAQGLESVTGIKEAINEAIKSGKPVDKEISQAVKLFLGFFDLIITEEVKNSQHHEQQIQAQTSPVPLQNYNAQSQASNAQPQGSNISQQQAAASPAS